VVELFPPLDPEQTSSLQSTRCVATTAPEDLPLTVTVTLPLPGTVLLPLLDELLSSEAICDIELLSEFPLSLKGENVEATADMASGRLWSHEPKSEKSFV
jgi:hypothetical protein